MSTLTKVFALLVSVLSIFLCGIVVIFATNTDNWKQGFENEKLLAQAAQVQAVVTQNSMTRQSTRYNTLLAKQQDVISRQRKIIADLSTQLETAKNDRDAASKRADSAVDLSNALRLTIADMDKAKNSLMASLQADREKMLAAQTQAIELTRQLNNEKVKNMRLTANYRSDEETISKLEDENSRLREKLKTATVASRPFGNLDQNVKLVPVAPAGVPIQGQVLQVKDGKVAISVGSSSGVRKSMKFAVTRGTKFLGHLNIIYVTPRQSVGVMTNKKGVVVPGDRVTTGLD